MAIKKDIKRKKTTKKVAGSTEEKNNIVPEEYEEDRSVNIRMKQQPLSQQPKDIPAKKGR
jgi:hypothetical protein